MSLVEGMLPLMLELPGLVELVLVSPVVAAAASAPPMKEAKGLLAAALPELDMGLLLLPAAPAGALSPDRPLKLYGDDPVPALTTKALLLPLIPTFGAAAVVLAGDNKLIAATLDIDIVAGA